MLGVLLTTAIACLPQGPRLPMASAVAVRGDTELTPAEALASAEARVGEHVRSRWSERLDRTIEQRRPFWLPELLTDQAKRRWMSDLDVERTVRLVDRKDRERTHEFGNSYQTTLWIAEDPNAVARSRVYLRQQLRELEHETAVKYGGVAAGWVVLALLLGWIDRLSRGYMTGRLRVVGLLGGLAMPALAFLV